MRSKIQQRNASYQKKVEDLFQKLSSNDDAILNMTALDGGWSAIQTLHHLILTEELALGYVRKKLSFNPRLDRPGPGAWVSEQLLKLYLALPFKFKAPPNVSEEKLPGFTSLKDTKNRWLKIREEWAAFLENLPDELVDKAVYKHPIAGRLGWLGMLNFFHHHFDRHRKQVFRAFGA
ncbi:MAG: DinB family protein [Bacteroidetes bacterium]|nr:MAG: DinB family protein [Bacteroidota bacterium]